MAQGDQRAGQAEVESSEGLRTRDATSGGVRGRLTRERGSNDDMSLVTAFLDLLWAYHQWCVRDDRKPLADCASWLMRHTPVPRDDAGWRRLGVEPVHWLDPLPDGWAPHWRILSPRERTLTVEALDYLEARRPGAIAAALPPVVAPPSPSSVLQNVPQNWSLSDVLGCIEREAARRQEAYPEAVKEGRLSAERARQELGQMKAAASILKSLQARGDDARQQRLF